MRYVPYNTLHLQEKRGFSLIEVLVSLSIFTVVVTISVGILMVLVAAHAKAQNTQAVMTNLSFALDSITREIRTGSDYFCGTHDTLPISGETSQNCPDGGLALSFTEGGESLTQGMGSRRIGLRLNNGAIERRLGSSGSWAPVTSPEVEITALYFYVNGVTRQDSNSPIVIIYLEGVAGVEDGSESTFHVQATVVQQLLDI